MTSSARHVAFCPFPFASHAAQMLLFAKKIAASSSSSSSPLHLTLFTTTSFAASLNLPSSETSIIRIHRVDGGGGGEGIEALVKAVAEGLRKGMEEAEEEVGVKITCIVADVMMTFVCHQVAVERRVMWVAMWTSSAGAILAHMNTDLLRASVAKRGKEAQEEDRVDEYIPGYPSIPILDLPHEILAVDDPIARILHVMSHHLQEAEAIIVNSIRQIEPVTTNILNSVYPNKFHYAGPYALTMPKAPHAAGESDPHECLHWLDSHAPSSVVYISFGSGLPPPLDEFASLAEALEVTKVPYLWSLPDKFRSHIPEKTTGLGKLVPWAPQMAVLAHKAVGAQVTHGGWSSVLESIASGVPMICRLSRSVADHALNGRMVELWGIGVEVEGGKLTKAATMAALDKVMVGEESKRIRKNIGELKRLAEEAVAVPGGSSTQSSNKIINIITS